MRYARLLCLFGVLVLAGCERHPAIMMSDRTAAPDIALSPSAGQSFAYTHAISLAMRDASVAPRFNHARDLCLHDKPGGCDLVSASLTTGDGTEDTSSFANLVVTLPHDEVAAFERRLTDPLPGQSASDAKITSRSTEAENVRQEASDTDRKLTQLTDYRDRLTALSKRSDVNVGDLIRIEQELSQTQAQLDQLSSQKRDVSARVARESLTVSFTAASQFDFFRPIARAWRNALQTLSDSAANALEFLIGVIPWLPIFVGGIFLISWAWRFFRRRVSKS